VNTDWRREIVQRDEITVAEVLRERLDAFTATERKAAHVLLTNYTIVGLETASEFARIAAISAPSVLRFISKLGFSSYLDFQRQIRREINAQIQPPLEKAGHGDADNSAAAFLHDFAEAVAHNIVQTVRHLPAKDFEAATALLSDPERRIFLIGGRFTDTIARNAAVHLRVVRPNAFHVAGQPITWRDQILEMNTDDIVVIFDVRRYQEDLAEFARQVHERGAVIILLTDQWLSPITRFAAHTLSARIAVPSNWDSSGALLTIAEALIASVTRKLWASAAKRIAQVEELRPKPR